MGAIITREIEDRSQHFEGEPQEGWEFLTVKRSPDEKCNTYYYRDAAGGYHHRTVKRKPAYSPYEIKVRRGENGRELASVVSRKTGQPVKRWGTGTINRTG